MVHKDIRISGRVQGVIFRNSAKAKADSLGISGFARNEPDNIVYIEAEGNEEMIDEFIVWCRQGPEWAKVENVEVKDSPVKNFNGFSIR